MASPRIHGAAVAAAKTAERAVGEATEAVKEIVMNKKNEVVMFSSTAIALYGYDQGMMALVNTNYNYLHTMGIGPEHPIVAVIVSVYYLGCAVGAVLGSRLADRKGRKPAILACIVATCLGNFIMFFSGFNLGGTSWRNPGAAMGVMLSGRVIMGLGVGAFDSVIPVFSAELMDSDVRGRALAQQFQWNIFGLNMAFIINVLVTRAFGKWNQWAWRIPIIAMQVYPLILFTFISKLPESPRWLLFAEDVPGAKEALKSIYDEPDAQTQLEKLGRACEEERSQRVTYTDMLIPRGSQYHPTAIVIMGQVNQAFTGYGCISVYGPQIFELLGFSMLTAEHIVMCNYLFYFVAMTAAWLLIDRLGRRKLMLWCSGILTGSFLLLMALGAIVMRGDIYVSIGPPAVAGVAILFVATAAFGIGWLTPAWLIPTEIYPSPARAKGAAISVIVWGISNFIITFISPILFNNLKYWIFLAFAITNAFAGIWTSIYSPETGGRTFEENVEFFTHADEQNTWKVRKVDEGKFRKMPEGPVEDQEDEPERQPLLSNQ